MKSQFKYRRHDRRITVRHIAITQYLATICNKKLTKNCEKLSTDCIWRGYMRACHGTSPRALNVTAAADHPCAHDGKSARLPRASKAQFRAGSAQNGGPVRRTNRGLTPQPGSRRSPRLFSV